MQVFSTLIVSLFVAATMASPVPPMPQGADRAGTGMDAFASSARPKMDASANLAAGLDMHKGSKAFGGVAFTGAHTGADKAEYEQEHAGSKGAHAHPGTEKISRSAAGGLDFDFVDVGPPKPRASLIVDNEKPTTTMEKRQNASDWPGFPPGENPDLAPAPPKPCGIGGGPGCV